MNDFRDHALQMTPFARAKNDRARRSEKPGPHLYALAPPGSNDGSPTGNRNVEPALHETTLLANATGSENPYSAVCPA
jgi:hypothetical protein